ncbi:hypothetical protein L3X38_011247 [Prunus dulcis]|uniref:Uncharacterized protein n=1 Tax=Prunus dulcis TaxID=3755 RepID=A0AAD4ZF85_PRUDU|nr:hypothetical protein L3X38_011247 [Prunus dulcis]
MERKCSSMGWSGREGMGMGLWVASGSWLGLCVVGGDEVVKLWVGGGYGVAVGMKVGMEVVNVEPFQTDKSLRILSIVGETC